MWSVLLMQFLVAKASVVPARLDNTVEVRLVTKGDMESLVGVEVFAQRMQQPRDVSRQEHVGHLLDGSGASLQVGIDSLSGWMIGCRGAAVWCPGLELAKPPANRVVLLPVYRKRSVSGSVEPPTGETLPTAGTIEGWIRESPTESAVHFSQDLEVGSDGAFHADLPEARLDLRLAFAGWVPLYFWGFAEGEVQFHELSLLRGASISGFVTEDSSRLPVKRASVRAAPLLGMMPERERANVMVAKTQTNQHGFFQVVGLAPGTYSLTIGTDRLAPARLGPIDLDADHEIRLEEVALSSFIDLTLEVSPSLDPLGRPWNISLVAEDGRRAEAQLDAEGIETISGIAPGEYRILVTGSDGDPYYAADRRIESSDVIELDIDLVHVKGTATLDGEPLQAKLALGAGKRDRLELRSDAEGAFEGWMRRPDTPYLWLYITALEGQLRRMTRPKLPPIVDGELSLDVELEDLNLAGVVVSNDGRPIPGARVHVSREERLDEYFNIVSDADSQGRFRVRGLPRGDFLVQAVAPETAERSASMLSSVPVRAAAVRDEAGGDLRLIVGRGTEIRGVLLDGTGQGVPGAQLRIVSFGAQPLEYEAGTSLDGEFRARLAPDARRASVVVFAPSQLLWAGCLEVPSSSEELWPIQLPPGPGGTLVLRGSADDAPPKSDGFPKYAFVTFDGGVVSLQHLVTWAGINRGGALGLSRDRPFLEAVGVAPGIYAPVIDTLGPYGLEQQVCAIGARPDADWESLPSGGSVSFELELPGRQELGGEFPFPDF